MPGKSPGCRSRRQSWRELSITYFRRSALCAPRGDDQQSPRSLFPSRAPAKCWSAWKPAGSAIPTCSWLRSRNCRWCRSPWVTRASAAWRRWARASPAGRPRRPRRHHFPGVHLRYMRAVHQRPRALLPAAAQFRIHGPRRAGRLRRRIRAAAVPCAGFAPRRRSRARCAAPAGPPTVRCAKPACSRANRSRYSAWAAWAISPSNTRGISACAWPPSMWPRASWKWPASLGADLALEADECRPHAAETVGRRRCGHRPDRFARRHSAGLPVAQAHRHADHVRPLDQSIRTAHRGYSAEGHLHPRQLSGYARRPR